MIRCEDLYQIMKRSDLTWFSGVPDSTFKEWMSFLNDRHGQGLTNRIAAIERDAIGWAAGYHVSTGKIGVVYMQNAGLGNVINPITSLADSEVYNIPMLLMIGWRGEPDKHDEPQHIKMGKITLPLLDVLGVKHSILPDNIEEAEKVIVEAKEYLEASKGIYALVVKKGTFEDYQGKEEKQAYEMPREEAIKTIVDMMAGQEIIVSTTGKTSRELFEYREEKKAGHQNDFLMVGSMGLAASFGAETALQRPERKVFIFDGDGAMIMAAGVLSTIGYYAPRNLYHIVLDNESHDSTGGQPTTSQSVDFEKLALANGYQGAKAVKTREELKKALGEMKEKEGPQMLVVKVKKGARKDLGRPTTTPAEDKKAFMNPLLKK